MHRPERTHFRRVVQGEPSSEPWPSRVARGLGECPASSALARARLRSKRSTRGRETEQREVFLGRAARARSRAARPLRKRAREGGRAVLPPAFFATPARGGIGRKIRGGRRRRARDNPRRNTPFLAPPCPQVRALDADNLAPRQCFSPFAPAPDRPVHSQQKSNFRRAIRWTSKTSFRKPSPTTRSCCS